MYLFLSNSDTFSPQFYILHNQTCKILLFIVILPIAIRKLICYYIINHATTARAPEHETHGNPIERGRAPGHTATPQTPFPASTLKKPIRSALAVFTVSRSLPVLRARVYHIDHEPLQWHTVARADRATYWGRDSINDPLSRPIIARFLRRVKCNNEYHRSNERIL